MGRAIASLLLVTIVGAVVLGIWLTVRGPQKTVQQHLDVGLPMLTVTATIDQYVRRTGEWPSGWSDLFPVYGEEHLPPEYAAIDVDWSYSLDTFREFVRDNGLTRADMETVGTGFATQRVIRCTVTPRDPSIDGMEQLWNQQLLGGLALDYLELVGPAE